MAERYWLDPDEVSSGRTQLEITHWVSAEGIDWGDAEIEAYMAEQRRGSTPVDFRIPNRQVVIPLSIRRGPGTTTFNQARTQLQAKVARLQQEGGWVKRITSAGTTLFADVVNASLKLSGSWHQAHRDVDIDAEMRLELIPDWYGAEIILPDRVETANWEMIWQEIGILGNYPGRMRLIVDDDQGQQQKALMWGIRSRHYDASTTARLAYEANQVTPLDVASMAGQVMVHGNLSTSWTPFLSTNMTGNVPLTHTGTYRVWARLTSLPGPTAVTPQVWARLVWDVGDFLNPAENTPAPIPYAFGLYQIVDLGEVRLDRVATGSHRWQGVIQVRGAGGGEGVQLHKIWFQPVDEGAGVLRAANNFDPGLATFSARDEFNQSAGALSSVTPKALPVGGSWQGAGDSDDFVMNTSAHNAQRTAVGDSGGASVFGNGRFALAGATTYANIVAQVDISRSVVAGSMGRSGLVVRYQDPSNYCFVGLSGFNSAFPVMSIIRSGVEQIVYPSPTLVQWPISPGSWYTVRVWVDSQGNFRFWFGPQGSTLVQMAAGVTTHLNASGLAAGTGRIGIADLWMPATAATRAYDNFAAWVPPPDAVLFPSQSAELRTEGMMREEATGSAYGPISNVLGDLPRIPPSGTENRPVQFFVKASRGDFGTLPDTGVDDISARIAYRPSYLFIS